MSSQRFDYLILIFFLIFSFLFDTGSEGAKVTGHIHSMAPASADTRACNTALNPIMTNNTTKCHSKDHSLVSPFPQHPYLDPRAHPLIFNRILDFLHDDAAPPPTLPLAEPVTSSHIASTSFSTTPPSISVLKSFYNMLTICRAAYGLVGRRMYEEMDLRVLPSGPGGVLAGAEAIDLSGLSDDRLAGDDYSRQEEKTPKAILLSYTRVFRSYAHTAHRCPLSTTCTSLSLTSLRTWVYDVSLMQPNHLGHTCSLGSSDLSIPHIAVVGLSSLASAAQSLIHVLKHDASLRAHHVTLVFGSGAKKQENEKGNIEIATEDGHDLLLIADALAEWQASCGIRYLQKITLVFLPRPSHGFALFTTTWMTKTHRKDAARDVVDLVRAIIRQSDLGVEVVGWEALVGLERGKKSGFRKAFNGELKARHNDTGNDGAFKLRAPKVAWGQATSAFEAPSSSSSPYKAVSSINQRAFANQPLQLSTRAQYLETQDGRDVVGDQAYIEWLQGPRGDKYGGRPAERVSNTVAT